MRRRIPLKTAALVRSRYDFCLQCGSDENLTLDHVIPVTRGGDNDPSNLQVLCGSCNSSKSSMTMDEWVNGMEATAAVNAIRSAGWTLREWSRRSGVSLNTLRSISLGISTNPRARTKAAMAEALRTSATRFADLADIFDPTLAETLDQ